jgi:hypothetical protein
MPFFAAVAASLLAYLATFLFLIGKPLTVGFIRDAFAVKQEYAARTGPPRLVIVAGSNGLFSHRCEAIEPILGAPCLNAAITAELGLGYTFELARRLVRSGDTVLLPLEYAEYRVGAAEIASGLAHPFRASYDRATLFDLPPLPALDAIFRFDFNYFIGAAVETLLARAGVRRRFSRENLTANGDMRDHTQERGAPFASFIADSPFWLASERNLQVSPGVELVFSEFFGWARQSGVAVIGTLPTTFDDQAVDSALVETIASFYRRHGAAFLIPPHHGQYPRSCFYDSQYHLNEPCQIRHSQLLASLLRPYLAAANN